MDKSLILNELKSHLGFEKDGELAKFLGIKQNTLSNWKSRNTIDYDLIITKCEKIDANWLITGKGNMLRSENLDNDEANANIWRKNAEHHLYTIEIQKKYIKQLELENENLKKDRSPRKYSMVAED